MHAGIAAARDLIPKDAIHPSLVLCTVADRDGLAAIVEKCVRAGVKHRVFFEADMRDEPTAVATAPVNGEARKLFKHLPLFTGG